MKEEATTISVSLAINNTVIEKTGKTITECLTDLLPQKILIKTKGIFTIKKGKLRSQRVMFPFEVKKLLISDFNKQVFEKRMLSVMK